MSTSNKDRMVRQKPFLKSILREANRKRRKALVDYANKDQINAVSELVLNTLKGRVPISEATRQRLQRHKNVLCKLSKRTTSLKAKKRLRANGWQFLAKFGLLSSSMSDLDIDPIKGPIPRLVGIIQKLNTDLESTQSRLQREQKRVQDEFERYQDISKQYLDLQSKYLCVDCQRHLRTTPKGDTICFCETCNDTKDTVVQL